MPNITKPSGMSTIWADTGVKTPPSASKIAQGWVVELPPYQTANFIENKQDRFNAHVNMHGIPQWDSNTEYQGGISYTKGSNGVVYLCLVTNTNSDPTNPLNANNWRVAFEAFGSVAVVQTQLNNLIANYGVLAGLTNTATARANLSVWSRSESDIRYAAIAGNSAQTFSVAPASLAEHAVRLDQVQGLIAQATETVRGTAKIATAVIAAQGTNDTDILTPLKATGVFLRRADNLSNLTSPAQARSNLGLGSIATEAAGAFLRASNNFSDVTDVVVARSNLGLTSTATQPETAFLRTAQNLSDVANAALARSNLGLGNSAVANIGTGVGTVAAGNDSRIVNAVPNTRGVVAGPGLVGGGALSTDRTLSLGTPSTINLNSTNSATAESHTHAFDITSFFGDRSLAPNGFYTLPGGFMVQWGTTAQIGGDNSLHATNFNRSFSETLFVMVGTKDPSASGALANRAANLVDFTTTGFRWVSDSYQSSSYAIAATWIAFGRV